MNNRSLFFGDNLEILMDKFPGNDGYFDLIYLDPPFNSNRNYNVLFKEGLVDSEAQAHAFEDSWHWTNETQKEFDYLMANGDIAVVELMEAFTKILGHQNDMMAYLTMMTLRLSELHRVLKPTGSLYLHCDPTASHYLKIVLDTIFGKMNFRNEIIWHYRRWTGAAKSFLKMHDTIFFYTKSQDYSFNRLFTSYTEGSVKRKEQGILHRFKAGEEPVLVSSGKVQSEGVPENDVWQIPFVAPSSKERLGYPTQKPEALLERIIKASSNEDYWILDPFCGCGTTVSVAERLKRNWVGIDISVIAVKLIQRRIIDQNPNLKEQLNLDGLPKDLSGAKTLFKNDPWNFEYWAAVHLLDARPPAGKSKENMKGADKGIDGIITLLADNKNGKNEYGKVIVQVKGGHVQRNQIATLKGDMARDKAIAGVFVTLESPTRPMTEEAAMAGSVKTSMGEFPAIQIITIEELLNGKKPNLPGMILPYKQASVNQQSQPSLGI
ncbi:MAG: site-specific DNA-methyltransferase [Actinobacteria bacterium]|nr:MAG: site-specific DNA-methyltransferase [Actinomycetota bacterium]